MKVFLDKLYIFPVEGEANSHILMAVGYSSAFLSSEKSVICSQVTIKKFHWKKT